MEASGRSRIFTGSRSLGEVSGPVGLVARYIKRRKDTLLVTAAGRSLHTYTATGLRLLTASTPLPEPPSALAADTYLLYCAAGNIIYAFRRGAELQHKYEGHTARIHLLLPFAHQLISIDEESTLKVWYVKEEQQYLELPFDNASFQITTIVHPSTYLNKVLLGSSQGSLQLWNLKTSKLIYTFAGWNSAVKVTEQAPAVDVVAIALANGQIILHNLKADKTVMQFTQNWGQVTTISFRTDGHPIMITGSSAGHLVMWDLEERRISSQIELAHSKSVANCICFPNEPIFATNSQDNSMKLWIFDMSDGSARLLGIREGHSSAPYIVRFTGVDNKTMLSTSMDRSLRTMSTLEGTHSISLGRASYNREASKKKKQKHEDSLLMPPITDFTYCTQRDKEWDSIAAVHQGLNIVTTWSLHKKKMGKHKLAPLKMSKDVSATCLTISSCGHFVFIGYSNGEVCKFNMQSGILRGRWGGPDGAHVGPIRGIETDNLNIRLMTVGVDNRLRIWPFDESKTPLKVIKLKETVSFTRCHRESSLIALCNEDYSILMTDIDSTKVIRNFEGHISKINDATFSNDSRWLISASMDCTIRTWDIPTGQMVDVFKVKTPCTSLSMSPGSDFLVTTHVGQLGAYLWANRTLYVHVNLRPIDPLDLSIPVLELPTVTKDGAIESIDDLAALNLNEDEFKSPEQISEDLITLSNLSTSRWQNLLNLDVIKQRNKPKQPPKAPKAAPFFLPTISNLETHFDLSDKPESDGSRMLIPVTFMNLTPFGKMIESAGESDDYSECIEKIKTFGPSMIDYEINSLSPDNGGSVAVLNIFLKMLNHMLTSNKNYELAQSYLGLFMKVHGQTIVESEELRKTLNEVEASQAQSWKRLQEKLFYNLCVIKSIKNM